MTKLSAFADEVTEKFRDQVEFLTSENVSYIEFRFLDGKNIMDLNQDELKHARNLLGDHGLKVSAIGSPIGKVKLDEPFEAHLDKFKHAVDLADFFNTPYIRIFSYYAPDGENINDHRDEVIRRMAAKVEIIKNTDVVMVHENEADIYGQSAQNCVDLAQAIDSPKLRLAYDPANFVWADKITDNVETCWPIMKPYVVHIHIKDWKVGAKTGAMPGAGDGQIKKLLAELAQMDYQGVLTLEPHLKAGGQFGGSTGSELFAQAIAAVRNLARDEGLTCE